MFKFFRKILIIFAFGLIIFVVVKYNNTSDKLDLENFKSSSLKELSLLEKEMKERLKNILDTKEKTEIKKQSSMNGYELQSLNNEDSIEVGNQDFSGTEDAIITLINKERFDEDLIPLKKNSLLMKSALAKAVDMKEQKYFKHISNEKIQPWFFAEDVGYQYQEFGENIATKYFSANSAHKAFMDSIGHRKNILKDNLRDVGVAILLVEKNENSRNEYIIVEHFGRYLKNIDLEKEDKYEGKNKLRCEVQEIKKRELKEMIKYQEEIIKQVGENKNNDILEKAKIRLKALKIIKEKINKYLDICEELRDKFNNL